MKIGSIVECIKSTSGAASEKGVSECVWKEVLTVNFLKTHNGIDWLGFEEKHQDIMYRSDHFREILPPEAMQKEINELLEINQPITT